MLSIGDLSKRTGVKVPTIRYYEQMGLLAAAERSEGNQRRYERQDLERIATDHLKSVRDKIEKLKKLEQELARIVSHCDGDHAIEDCYVIRSLSDHGLCDSEH